MSGNLGDFLTSYFRRPKLATDDIRELESGLASLVSKQRNSDDINVALRVQDELKKLHKSVLTRSPEKVGPFISVLKVVRPLIIHADDIAAWLDVVVVSFVDRTDQTRKSAQDARDFVVDAMTHNLEHGGNKQKQTDRCASHLRKIIQAAIRRIDIILGGDTVMGHSAADQGLQTLQGFLLAFGRKQPLDLFEQLERFVLKPATRFQALQLLCLWLQQQQAHFDLVVKTSLVPNLLLCLLNDRATAVINLALQAIVMLIPHIPAYIAQYLTPLFLVYSRCLQWEVFDSSAKSDNFQHDGLPTTMSSADDSLAFSPNPEWQALSTVPLQSDAPDPALLTLFTYLYGLYPLNLMCFIRGPRKYLQDKSYPGSDDYYLDLDKIRTRSEQFQRVHLLHPALFGSTSEQELAQNRWVTSETPEVIAECFGLRVKEQIPKSLSALPSPEATLDLMPDISAFTPVESPTATLGVPSSSRTAPTTPGTNSPLSVVSGDPPVPLNAGDMPALTTSATNLSATSDRPSALITGRTHASQETISLQHELQIMRSAYQFESYLKQLHVVTIGQLKRDRIRQVIREAESDRLHATTRTLTKQLEAAMRFNETLQKEAQNRRTHISKSEEQLMTKIRGLRDELRDHRELRAKNDQVTQDVMTLRQLLVESESREVRLKSDLEQAQKDHAHGRQTVSTTESRPISSARDVNDIASFSMPNINMATSFTTGDDERDRIRREYDVRILNLEETLKLSQKSQADSAQGTLVLQQKLLESHSKRLSLEKALTTMTRRFNELQAKYENLITAQAIRNVSPERVATLSLIENVDEETAVAPTNGAHRAYPIGEPTRPSFRMEVADAIFPLSRSEGMAPSTVQELLPVPGMSTEGPVATLVHPAVDLDLNANVAEGTGVDSDTNVEKATTGATDADASVGKT